MNLREAAQQALEALEWYADHSVADVYALDAAAALRAALAEPEHEIIQRMRKLKAEARAEQQQAIEQGKCPSCMQPLPEELKTEYAMQKLTDIHQEFESGCARCRNPLWCGVKCDVCGQEWVSTVGGVRKMTPIEFVVYDGDSEPNTPIHKIYEAMNFPIEIIGPDGAYDAVSYYFNDGRMVLEVRPAK